MARLFRSQSSQRPEPQYGSDPYCQLAKRKQFDQELDTIRAQSRSIWSKPDTSLTTHGHYFADPQQSQRTLTRPTSAGRRHNPHPKLVFMRTGMREIPNAYGAPPAREPPLERIPSQQPIVPHYLEQIQDLNTDEQQGVQAFLKAANEDSKGNVGQALKNYRISMKNEYECPPIGVATVCREDGSRTEIYPSMDRYRQAIRNEKEYTAVNQALEKPETNITVVNDQPILKRNVRFPNRPITHFQRRSHSHNNCPWPLACQPYRGDYSIHMDWHPRLPHHRLTCLC